jgi:type VI secretion system secreted protein VgrG
VDLGTAESFALLAGESIINYGPSVVVGDVGISPGSGFSGFPPGTVTGTVHVADAVAAQAQADLTAAINDANGRTPDAFVGFELGGLTLTPGVYANSSSNPFGATQLNGTLTLDAEGDPAAVFILQGNSLYTGDNSTVALINGADPCNVFWRFSGAFLGVDSVFAGTVLGVGDTGYIGSGGDVGVTMEGRLLTGGTDVGILVRTSMISLPECDTPPPTTTTTAPPTTTTTAPPTTTRPTRIPPVVIPPIVIPPIVVGPVDIGPITIPGITILDNDRPGHGGPGRPGGPGHDGGHGGDNGRDDGGGRGHDEGHKSHDNNDDRPHGN